MSTDKTFGALITRLIDKTDLTRDEARDAFTVILNDNTTAMQQGAFLAALRAKGETEAEVAGAWEAIFDRDTVKVTPDTGMPVVENSGTGMDSFKTFNISTAAAIVAAAAGVPMARHGARAITSVCGTVDMAETLGVDVACDADLVARSIKDAGIGLFNGMSPTIHPMALGRILSQIHFGSTLNIAASLANPAMPRFGVRGVYAREMIDPVVRVMKAIGYRQALVFHGAVDGTNKGMDEASVCGTTWYAQLGEDGTVDTFRLKPSELGLAIHNPADLAPEKDLARESRRFVALIRGQENGTSARRQALELNTALILKVAGKVDTIPTGMALAGATIDSGNAYATLENWVTTQNRQPEEGLARLRRLKNAIN
ncbi:anthranilate phosphoribosyltransferase [Desulfosarcina ovata subsp. sediminis]|uniref:Anthranilate phosphoribosyltransferase n=1 Tax=Desulfosarcina ovata subsp. sediminis TaxID=885957 RepID=A0A5K7ZTZ5_9BACT|nr:anthranilate phosphoribosyltransferase [Desulfosarcina ovata]BBO83695.1 anthranilate phosphoribosyltransferase [Desulfosarcina ovata subsp. sediminis]